MFGGNTSGATQQVAVVRNKDQRSIPGETASPKKTDWPGAVDALLALSFVALNFHMDLLIDQVPTKIKHSA